MPGSKLLEEFEAAQDDLGIEIIAPYEIELTNGGKIRADILVSNFGAPNGMLVFITADAVAPFGDSLCDMGYGVSVMGEPAEANYDRDVFIDILSDWQWTGPVTERPKWIKAPLGENKMGSEPSIGTN